MGILSKRIGSDQIHLLILASYFRSLKIIHYYKHIMSTFAVTGANGFIASHLITKILASGHKVHGTVRDTSDVSKMKTLNELSSQYPDKLQVFMANLKDPKSMKEAFAGVDGVFHLAAVHPEYGFQDVPGGREELISTAVEGSLNVMKACKEAEVKRVVLTSSIAAVECGNDDSATLTESTWSDASVYDNKENHRGNGQWSTHYTYVKSKVEQEKAVTKFCTENKMDLRVVVPGNMCVGPVASTHLNGTMQRLADIMQGTNTLKGGADYGVVHVQDVVATEIKCMTTDSASGRYLVSSNMVLAEDVFKTIKELYPQYKIAELNNQDTASGIQGKARNVETRVTTELGVELAPLSACLKEAIDSMVDKKFITPISD